ncbi:MAG: M1 family aminopeptidase [Gemmataceae bacterium]
MVRRLVRSLLSCLALGLASVGSLAAAAVYEAPPYLPRYDLDIFMDLDQHIVRVQQRVLWTNTHQRPAHELVFNVHSHFQLPKEQVALTAKTLELLRMAPHKALDTVGRAGNVEKVTSGQAELPFYWKEDNHTALVVPLPDPVGPGQSIEVGVTFTLRLPPKQGRWGQWKGVTYLSHWLPILAYYDDCGWQPTPFVPWHQPFFNEAGVYSARVTLPGDQIVACTGPIVGVTDLDNGWQCLDIGARPARDFALLCSARYRAFHGQAGPVAVSVLAFPEHEHYARAMVGIACEAITTYSKWFGPYPYENFTIAESYFPWNGNECSGLVMIDHRVFNMPHLAENYVDYLVSHEICHQWWYNVVGTNGYCETWMDEGLATHLSHRLLNQKHGKNNTLLKFPGWLEWLPNIRRDNYRHYGFYGSVARGETTRVVQDMEKFGHVVTLFSMCYDKGSKVTGMIEDRLGEAAFLDFLRIIYAKYYFRVLRIKDFQRELEEYTGYSWEEFFHRWLYGEGLTDWCLEKVRIEKTDWSRWQHPIRDFDAPADCRCRRPCGETAYKVTVFLRQKGDFNEPTVVGFSFDGKKECYPVRVPLFPQAQVLELDEPPARVVMLSADEVRLDVILPCPPTQVTVDPDHILVDRNPANNYWKPRLRWRLTPLYTQLEETDLAGDYTAWNIIAGPWVYAPTFNDAWFTRSEMAGVRLGLYRTQQLAAGVYAAYRTDYRDIAVGVDVLRDHWPWPNTQVGFLAERHLTGTDDADEGHADRGVLYGRYIITYGSSLYLPPFHYVDLFGAVQDDYLPSPRRMLPPGARQFNHQTLVGLHHQINYLTPYWDPAAGFRWESTYAYGLPVRGVDESYHQLFSQFSLVKSMPNLTGWLGDEPAGWKNLLEGPLRWLSLSRWAFQLYGAIGFPTDGAFFTLGGSQLLRGFDLSDRQGNIVWVANVEWRLPVFYDVNWNFVDRTAGIRNVYVAGFYDIGDAYINNQSQGSVVHSVGGGLRVDMAWFSFIEHSVIRLDFAKAIHQGTPIQVWFGFQHPF